MKPGISVKPIGCLFFALFLISSCGETSTMKYYVSPSGDDSNKGSPDAPFRTITKARDHIRSLSEADRKRDVEVILRGGTYLIREPIVFNLIDGGNGKHSVRYRAAEGEIPVISSGRYISGWQLLTNPPGSLPGVARGKVWVAEIPGEMKRFYTLFDGEDARDFDDAVYCTI